MAFFDHIKSKLTTAVSQVGKAGLEMHTEMQFDRVRRWIEDRPPEVTDREIVEALRQIARTDSRITPEAHRLLAEKLTEQGDSSAALQHLQAAIDCMTADVPVTTREWIAENRGLAEDEYLCELYTELASTYERAGQLQQAVDAAQRAVALYDRDLTPYHTWASCLFRQGLQEKAIKTLDRARTFDNFGLVDGWVQEFLRVGLLRPDEDCDQEDGAWPPYTRTG